MTTHRPDHPWAGICLAPGCSFGHDVLTDGERTRLAREWLALASPAPMAADRDAAVAALTMLTPEEIAELRDRLAALTEGLTPGPFHAMPANRRSDEMFWLDNEAGDSAFPDGEDVALFLNVLPRMLAAIDALPGTLDAAWSAVEAALPEGWAIGRARRYDVGDSRPYDTLEWEPAWDAVAWSIATDDLAVGYGPTPAEALLALAAKLREPR